MGLVVDYFEIGMLLGACFLVNWVTSDAKTNMSEGLTMLSFYVMIVSLLPSRAPAPFPLSAQCSRSRSRGGRRRRCGSTRGSRRSRSCSTARGASRRPLRTASRGRDRSNSDSDSDPSAKFTEPYPVALQDPREQRNAPLSPPFPQIPIKA